MKRINITGLYGSIVSIMLLMVLFVSCQKDDSLGEAPRLFRPALKGDLQSTGNFIEVAWQDVRNADSYTVQISRDTFKTIDRSVDVDTAMALLENVLWDQLYQVQVRANNIDSVKNSKFAFLGEVKTPKFPSILKDATINDVTDNAAIMRWTPKNEPLTEVKVYTEPERTLFKTVSLNSTDLANEYRIITGLSSGTSYYMELYSGSKLRGYNIYTTKEPFSGVVIDLRDFTDRPSVLQDTLELIPSGSVVLLKKGFTYTINSGISLSKSVTITSGNDLLVQEPATIFISTNFNFAAGSAIDSISFINVHLKGNDYSGGYVFNTDKNATVGKIKFESSTIEIFRGITRMKGGTATVGTYQINNSIVDSIGGYGLLTVDANTCKVENIAITNSTISRTEKLVASSKNSSNSVQVENCTIHRAPLGGNYLIDYGSQAVTLGVKFYNNILSIGKDKAGNVSTRGVRLNGTVDGSGNYSLSDFVDGGYSIPSVVPYTRPSTEVYTDPLSLNFKIRDNGFPGRSSAGDPRWRL